MDQNILQSSPSLRHQRSIDGELPEMLKQLVDLKGQQVPPDMFNSVEFEGSQEDTSRKNQSFDFTKDYKFNEEGPPSGERELHDLQLGSIHSGKSSLNFLPAPQLMKSMAFETENIQFMRNYIDKQLEEVKPLLQSFPIDKPQGQMLENRIPMLPISMITSATHQGQSHYSESSYPLEYELLPDPLIPQPLVQSIKYSQPLHGYYNTTLSEIIEENSEAMQETKSSDTIRNYQIINGLAIENRESEVMSDRHSRSNKLATNILILSPFPEKEKQNPLRSTQLLSLRAITSNLGPCDDVRHHSKPSYDLNSVSGTQGLDQPRLESFSAQGISPTHSLVLKNALDGQGINLQLKQIDDFGSNTMQAMSTPTSPQHLNGFSVSPIHNHNSKSTVLKATSLNAAVRGRIIFNDEAPRDQGHKTIQSTVVGEHLQESEGSSGAAPDNNNHQVRENPSTTEFEQKTSNKLEPRCNLQIVQNAVPLEPQFLLAQQEHQLVYLSSLQTESHEECVPLTQTSSFNKENDNGLQFEHRVMDSLQRAKMSRHNRNSPTGVRGEKSNGEGFSIRHVTPPRGLQRKISKNYGLTQSAKLAIQAKFATEDHSPETERCREKPQTYHVQAATPTCSTLHQRTGRIEYFIDRPIPISMKQMIKENIENISLDFEKEYKIEKASISNHLHRINSMLSQLGANVNSRNSHQIHKSQTAGGSASFLNSREPVMVENVLANTKGLFAKQDSGESYPVISREDLSDKLISSNELDQPHTSSELPAVNLSTFLQKSKSSQSELPGQSSARLAIDVIPEISTVGPASKKSRKTKKSVCVRSETPTSIGQCFFKQPDPYYRCKVQSSNLSGIGGLSSGDLRSSRYLAWKHLPGQIYHASELEDSISSPSTFIANKIKGSFMRIKKGSKQEEVTGNIKSREMDQPTVCQIVLTKPPFFKSKSKSHFKLNVDSGPATIGHKSLKEFNSKRTANYFSMLNHKLNKQEKSASRKNSSRNRSPNAANPNLNKKFMKKTSKTMATTPHSQGGTGMGNQSNFGSPQKGFSLIEKSRRSSAGVVCRGNSKGKSFRTSESHTTSRHLIPTEALQKPTNSQAQNPIVSPMVISVNIKDLESKDQIRQKIFRKDTG
jgi:hypothetical protein